MEFIRFPSISVQPAHAPDVRRCAEWLASHLRHVGLEHVSLIPTPRHPIVYADWVHAPSKPSLLIYGHYDVQPVDPLTEWHSPPFEPTIRHQHLFGRGASDDKGQMFAHVKSIEWYLRTHRHLPLNVRCLFEGEEELGSPHLADVLEIHRQRLAVDVAVISDTRILGPERPAITESVRGSVSFELEMEGPTHDLHSGNFGGAVPNPLRALCSVLARLHDERGRITIAGFYDGVHEATATERIELARAGPSDAQLLVDAGASEGFGEAGYTLYERTTIRPALEITGVYGGYQGPGVKAVIPARAVAKLNVRLVAGQDPGEVDGKFRRHIVQMTPRGIRCSVRTSGPVAAARVDRSHRAIRAAATAYRKAFGVAPVFLRSGGTIPAVGMFRDVLRIPTVLMGFALPDDRPHAPNEQFHLPTYLRGIQTSVNFLAELGSPS
jgi:acetylornithine deacetylase/succinyl-diaminopimelate desuccinylase-like protein